MEFGEFRVRLNSSVWSAIKSGLSVASNCPRVMGSGSQLGLIQFSQ